MPSYIFLTSGTSVTIPDLTSFGVKLPANTDYTWVVYGFGPYANVEAASAGLRGAHQYRLPQRRSPTTRLTTTRCLTSTW